MKLRFKIVLPLIAQLFVTVVVFHTYILPKLHESLEEDFIANQQVALQSVSRALVPALLANELSVLGDN